jgi:rhodanese-related sulfurtransferase
MASPIAPESTLQQVLEAFPGARRALFRRYHIGGCSSCGFQPEETLAQLCQRNSLPDPAEVIAHIRDSHEQDERIWIAPSELADRLRSPAPPRILDIRSREEWEAVRITGSVLLGQELMQEILGRWPRDEMFVICDHTGKQGLDAAAYFLGHGFTQVRCLRGGIDAWSQEVDPALRRYRLEAP